MTNARCCCSTKDSSQAAWLPRRISNGTWEALEEKFGLKLTGRTSTEMQSACEVILPPGWRIVESKDSFFKRWLVDNDGCPHARLFYKEYRADFMELV